MITPQKTDTRTMRIGDMLTIAFEADEIKYDFKEYPLSTFLRDYQLSFENYSLIETLNYATSRGYQTEKFVQTAYDGNNAHLRLRKPESELFARLTFEEMINGQVYRFYEPIEKI